MGKWMDALKNLQPDGFGGFGGSTTGHIKEKFADTEIRRQALKRLEVAAANLPITLDELSAFFADDLQSFGTGEVTQDTIKQLAQWFAYQHLGRHDPIPEPTPKEAGMVRCTDCLQDRCSYRQVMPWGDVVIQSSHAYRWCKDYTARVHHLDDYRKR